MSVEAPIAQVTLPANWLESEKGNTMLETDDHQLAVWIHIKGKVYLEVTDTPDNSPRFYVTFIESTKKDLIRSIREKCEGWSIVRWNLSNTAPSEDGRVRGIRSRK